MNKLLLFPLALMLILTILASVYSGYVYTPDETSDYSDVEGINISGDTPTIDIEGAEPQTFNVYTAAGVVVILTAAIAVGVLAGVNVLGSGLSDSSQRMIFIGILFGGLWAVMSVISVDFLFENWMTTAFWTGVTMMYVIGVATEVNR